MKAPRPGRGTGDFDGDGHDDILWRHDTGQVAIWFMVQGNMVGQSYPGGQDLARAWSVQSVGDFDGDGRSDILWRHVHGQLGIWFSGDANTVAFPDSDQPPNLQWTVQGVGDFDGDSHADILLRHSDGQMAIWLMNGGSRVGESYPGGHDPSWWWRVQAIGDVDGDGRDDILWRDGAGLLGLWFGGAEGYSAPSYRNATVTAGDLSRQVIGLADFDGDGSDDIAWRHSGGLVAAWLLDGARFLADVYPGLVDSGWQIKGLMSDRRRPASVVLRAQATGRGKRRRPASGSAPGAA